MSEADAIAVSAPPSGQVAEFRARLALTLAEFGARIGLSKSQMHEVERSDRASLRVALAIEDLSGGEIDAALLCDDVRLARHGPASATNQPPPSPDNNPENIDPSLGQSPLFESDNAQDNRSPDRPSGRSSPRPGNGAEEDTPAAPVLSPAGAAGDKFSEESARPLAAEGAGGTNVRPGASQPALREMGPPAGCLPQDNASTGSAGAGQAPGRARVG